MVDVRIKRAYDPPAEDDGQRVLVDRVWPRGVTREEARLDAWERDVAPSVDLRRWFGHDPARWEEFRKRYRAELEKPPASTALERLAERARHGRLTLVYSARDTEHNQAVVLAEALRESLAGGKKR
jgi:uncharacterized protein YeaO (DUF488 family)